VPCESVPYLSAQCHLVNDGFIEAFMVK